MNIFKQTVSILASLVLALQANIALLPPQTLLAQVSGGTVVFDSATNSGDLSNQTSGSWSHTTSGSERYLVVGLSGWDNSDSLANVQVTYGGVSMTKLGGQQAGGINNAVLWGLTNPALGANIVSISNIPTNYSELGGGSVSFTGVDQAFPVGSLASNQTASANISLSTGDMGVDILYSGTGNEVPVIGSGGTQRVNTHLSSNSQKWMMMGTESGSGTVNMSWTDAGGSDFAIAVIPIKASSAPVQPFAPVISSFSASPSSVSQGNSSTLSWSVSGNPATTISIDNGLGTVSGTSVSVSPSVTTTYTLTATNSQGSVQANTTVTVSQAPQPDTTPPSTPTNLSATTISSSQINLSWTASTDNVGVTGYDIYRNSSLIATVTGISYQNTGLSVSTNYSYTVRSKDAAGNVSAQSSSASATTQAGTIPPPPSGTQPWSNIIDPDRAIDWSKAGLPAVFPNGETTPNPWTPPTRTLCRTLSPSGGNDVTAIMNAISGCAPGTYVSLSAGTFQIQTTLRMGGTYTSGRDYVTVRGQGPMSTKLTGGGDITIGAAASAGSATLTSVASNFVRGQTTFTLQNVSGTLVPNSVAYFTQNDPPTDPLGPWSCQSNACAFQGFGGNNSQVQWVRIVSAVNNGNGTWTVTVDPGLYMSNWSFALGAKLAWYDDGYNTIGMGLENLSLENVGLEVGNGYASWVKGVRMIGFENSGMVYVKRCSHCLVSNNYFFAGEPDMMGDGSYTNILVDDDTGDTLILNNIGQHGMFNDNGGHHQGYVLAYNYSRDVITSYYQATAFEHTPGSNLILREGNQFGRINDDNTHNTHNFNTDFRNNLNCGDYPYDVNGWVGGGFHYGAFSRFNNSIGNAIGLGTSGMPSKCPGYEGFDSDGSVFNINSHANQYDTTGLTEASLLRWGNVSHVRQPTDTPSNSGIRFNASEIPTNLSQWPNSVLYQNFVPATTNLPCSFFLKGYLSTNCTPTYNGGTGLSWWKVCDTWGTFPTNCSHSIAPPFPATGPDIRAINGAPVDYANDIPAALAWKNLPIDTSFQNSYTVTGSTYDSNRGEVVLNVSGLPSNTTHLLGGFSLQGVPSVCNPSGKELLMTRSSNTQIRYALASNPGVSCTGTMKWPNVRQFDERVYQADIGIINPPPTTYTITASAGTGGSISPSGSVFVTQGNSQTFTITPSIGYNVSSIMVDGSNMGAITTYTFSNVTANHTISATFTANQPVPGDFNLDHVVNTLDFSLLNSKWLQNYPPYDLFVDGLINSLDFAIFSSNWGKTW